MKNLLLKYLGDWAIDKETLQAVKDSIPMIVSYAENKGEQDMGELPIDKLISEPVKEVYTVPLFTENFCRIVVDEIKSFKFEPNDSEDELRQIPEIILSEKLPDFYRSMVRVVESLLNPIFLAIWQTSVESSHIQIANYNPKDKKAGAWHHDASSDITVVVPLNTGNYKGGGTDFYKRGTVEPLPNGTALIFPGLTHLHRGRIVEEGDRFLLVFWLKCNHRDK